MRIKTAGVLLACASLVYADSYDVLLKRYEKQIRQQERQLKALSKSLQEKEKDAQQWLQKADQAKTEWSRAGVGAEHAREMVASVHQSREKAHTLAESAQWSSVQRAWMGQSANTEIRFLAAEVYKRQLTPHYLAMFDPTQKTEICLVQDLATLSQRSHAEAEDARRQEIALRTEEMRWQNEEQSRSDELARLHHDQQASWLRWQDAQRRRTLLEEEKNQLDESAQALKVMIDELKQHHEETLAAKREESGPMPSMLTVRRGSLPWPAEGHVVQNFGRQYSPELQQLIVSNGIKIEATTGQSVRAVEAGKVLFARPFDQYGQLVIVQHHHGLTSIYGGLGELSVKEGDMLTALDLVGTVGDSKSFYFELRHDEEPINPLVWLAPSHRSELTSRRKFQ